uniref:Uncharacterized protein n=1 Tax=Nelumbo nucifera TaxID=4432 RepID=A0A822XXT6_NELNU|nr:TPA_asm: hypothetical protein HUJ06_026591 [Nelumbo nucifera]
MQEESTIGQPAKMLSSTNIRRLSGPTMALDVWNMPEGQWIKVEINEHNQPSGEGAKQLIKFLGSIARMPYKLPMDFVDWRKVIDELKDDIWDIVEKKFDVDEWLKDFSMKSLGKKWKDWKCDLKTKYFDPNADITKSIQIGKRVDPE